MPNYYSIIKPRFEPYLHQYRCVPEIVDGVLNDGFRALFAEMATGKTKMVLDSSMVLYQLHAIDGLVVLCPKSVMGEWKDQCETHLTIPYGYHQWGGSASRKEDELFRSMIEFDGFKVYVVNIEAFQTVPDAMRAYLREFMYKKRRLIACDESSFIGNSESNRSYNSFLASSYSVGKVVMTGTEVGRNILPLYAQFEWLKGGFFGYGGWDKVKVTDNGKVKDPRLFKYKLNYCNLSQEINKKTGKRYYNIVGFKNTESLFNMLKPYISRARKSECPDIPDKVFKTIMVDLSPKQKTAMINLKNNLTIFTEDGVISYENKSVIFGKARQIVGGGVKVGVAKEDLDGCDSKEYKVEWIDKRSPRLQALLDSIADHDDQAIVWSIYSHEIDMLMEALSPYGKCVQYDGRNVDSREDGKRLFKSGEARFFIGNPMAGAFGLNLQNCHIQYFYNAPTSPTILAQVIDRTNRPGQKYECIYVYIYARRSIDTRVASLIEEGMDIQEAIKKMDTKALEKLLTGEE